MGRWIMKVSVLAALTSCILLTTGLASPSDASIRKTTNIPAEPLSEALRTLAKDRQFEILYRAEVVRDVRTAGAIGEFTPEEALKALLSGTGLSYKYLDANTVTVVPPSSSNYGQSNPTNDVTGDSSAGGGKKSSQDFRVAQTDSGQTQGSAAVAMQSGQTSSQATPPLQEVIVTAQKREQRLQDVPIAISVVTAESLLSTNQTGLHDYYSQVPGLSVAQMTIGPSAVAIRGITTGINQNPTVGFTLDDVPLGSSTGAGGLGLVPEVNPADLARIEVLQGPQGTLYGANSLGGLIRFVTLDPSTRTLSGVIDVGGSTVENAGDMGYNADGAVNIPVSDAFAIRASAFLRRTPGYIDNVESGQKGVNTDQVYGGHLATLWNITPDLTLKVGAFYEEDRRGGSNDVDVPTATYPQTTDLHGLEQYYLPGTGGYYRQSQIYDAVFTAHVGGVELTAITGYNINAYRSSDDLSSAFPPGDTISFPNEGHTDKFSEELRALAHIGSSVDLLLGGFYTHEYSPSSQQLLLVNPSNGATVSTLYNSTAPTTYEEEAGFADLTWHLTDKFDIQLGGRESHLSVDTKTAIASGPFASGNTPATSTPSDVFTYLVSPEYKLSSDLMVYGRVATGYRPGGATNVLCSVENFACHYGPDRTTDYELGLKGAFADGKISLDGSLFYIDWHNLQLDMSVDNGKYSFTGNGSQAKSDGVQLSAEARPVEGLKLSGWIAYDDAVLTRDLPVGPDYGLAGDRLPYSARISGNLAAQQEFPINANTSGFVGGVLIYIGERAGEFTASALRTDLPAYTQINLRGGVKWGQWTGSIYTNNVGNVRGVVFGGLGTSFPFGFQYIQPRTIGLNLGRAF